MDDKLDTKTKVALSVIILNGLYGFYALCFQPLALMKMVGVEEIREPELTMLLGLIFLALTISAIYALFLNSKMRSTPIMDVLLIVNLTIFLLNIYILTTGTGIHPNALYISNLIGHGVTILLLVFFRPRLNKP